MTDMFDLNYGGATHVGALAVVYPGADASEEGLTVHRVVEETEEHMTLTDGSTYCKLSGAPRDYCGPPTFRYRIAITEGNAMFADWAARARDPQCWYVQPESTGAAFAPRRPSRIKQLIGRH